MPAAAHAKKVVQAYGGNLDSHRARDVRELAEEPRWVLTMTRAQAERLVAVRPEWAEKIYVLTEFVGEHGDISDPVGQDLAVYQRVAEELDRLLEKVHQRLTEEGAGADASDRRD
jgi:protein-tyrosine phosphatase